MLPVPDCAMFFKSVKVFRCQLSRDNPFYPSEPPKKDGTEPPEARGSIQFYFSFIVASICACITIFNLVRIHSSSILKLCSFQMLY